MKIDEASLFFIFALVDNVNKIQRPSREGVGQSAERSEVGVERFSD